MRALRITGLVLFVLICLGGIAWLILRQPKPQIIVLRDGSRLTLLKVTYGTNHVCRYGTGWQEIVYPFLPKSLKANLSPRVKQVSSASDTLMVWFRHDGTSPNGGWPASYFISAADESRLESGLWQFAQIVAPMNPAKGPAPTAIMAARGKIMGWEVTEFPRRAKQFHIRIYSPDSTGNASLAGEFLIQHPAQKESPHWVAEALPISRRTNELEITLTKLETGLTGHDTGIGPSGTGAKAFSRATFRLKENGASTEKWSICRISARNAGGEIHAGRSHTSRWLPGEHTVDFSDGLWLEEAAWQVDADFARTSDFPQAELWVIDGVRAPQPDEVVSARTALTRDGRELEFLGISGSRAKLPDGYTGVRPNANVHGRTPYPLDDLRIVLVEVRDDQGRKAQLKGSNSATTTGGGGATPKQMVYGFSLEIPERAQTLNVTLAVTRIRHAQFTAKPVLFKTPAKGD